MDFWRRKSGRLHSANPRERRGCEVNTAQELIAQVADLPAMLDGYHSRWISRAIAAMKQQQQELAALRSRIDTAPVAIMDTRKALGL